MNPIQLTDDPDIRLIPHVDETATTPRAAILVIPGGAYCQLCTDREGDCVAEAFLSHGLQAFVLHYSLDNKAHFPKQLQEAALALKYIRDHAQEYHIDPERVFVVGFSAGGHLTSTLGTMWHSDAVKAVVGQCEIARPTGMILVYPVISTKLHEWSFKNLWQTQTPTQEQLDAVSSELHVDERTCPAFMVHTTDDEAADVRNVLCFAEALSAHNIPYEMHIYPSAPHGWSLAIEETSCGHPAWVNPQIARWVSDAVIWMDTVQ